MKSTSLIRNKLLNRVKGFSNQYLAKTMSDNALHLWETSHQLFLDNEEILREKYPGKWVAFVDNNLLVANSPREMLDQVELMFPGSSPISSNFAFNYQMFQKVESYYCKELDA